MGAIAMAPSALAQALLAAAQGFSAQAQVLLALAQIFLAQDQPTPRGPARRRRRRRIGVLGAASPSEESNSPPSEETAVDVSPAGSHVGIATPCWSDAEHWCTMRGLLCSGVAAPPGLLSPTSGNDISVPAAGAALYRGINVSDADVSGINVSPAAKATPCVESTDVS